MGTPPVSPYVHQTEFKNLYHYEPFVPDHLISTLQHQKIHCSSPDNFNDPWDCKPEFDPSCADDEATFSQVIEWFHSQATVTLPEHLKRQWENRLWSDPRERLKFLRDTSQSNIQIISQRRIYCLSAVKDDILMWSHYTDKHKGICFEFDIHNQLIKAAREIIYSDEYPIWHPHEFQKNQRRGD